MRAGSVRNLRHGKQRGSSAVEMVCGLIVAVPIVLCIIDLGFIAMGASANDNVCREAAQAAAAAPPSTTTAPSSQKLVVGQAAYDAAVSVIKVQQPTNLPAKVSDQPEVKESLTDVPPKDAGGAVDGDVSVTTTVFITPPFLVGAYFGKDGVNLKSTHVTPFTYVVPKEQPPP